MLQKKASAAITLLYTESMGGPGSEQRDNLFLTPTSIAYFFVSLFYAIVFSP